MAKCIFLFLTLSFYHFDMFGQLTATGDEIKIDSLRSLIITEKKDTNQVNVLNSLGFEYSVLNFSEAKFYLNKAEHLARIINFKKGIANSLSFLGIAYETQGDYFEALSAQIAALKIREEIGDKSGISYSIHYIGDIYFGQSDLSDKATAKTDYNAKALEQFFNALKIAEEIKDVKSIANTYNCIGNSYREKENYSSALDYYNKAVEIRERIGDKINLSTTFVNLGKLYLKQKNYPTALDYLFRALRLSEELKHKRTNIKALGTIAAIFYMQKKYKESIDYCNKSLELGRKVGYLEYIAKANNLLSQIYSAEDFTGRNSDIAFQYYKAYINEKDSIDTKKANQLELQFDFDKKEELAKAEHARQLAISDAEKKKQKAITWFVATGLLFVLVFAALIFRSLQITQKQKLIIEQKEKETQLQKHLIEDKHKEITDSINYAERIQRSFLATNELLNENLKEYFVFFQPKDVVSGDFYWAAKLSNGNFALMTADSTGHGVPGAIMSILNITCVEKAVEEEELLQPSKILNHTRDNIIKRLQRDGSEQGGKDGMDAILICFDFKKSQLTYAAAHNPLWIVRNGQLHEYEADKMPVGKHDKDSVSFTQHAVTLHKGDVVYSLTDGMADQFGGPNGKKFMYKRLKELLISIAEKPMAEQKEALMNALNEWKGDLEQVDDICVIGVKV